VSQCHSLFGLKDEGNSNPKNRLKTAQWIRKIKIWGFSCGAREDDKKNSSYTKSIREIKLEQTLEKLRSGNKKDLQEYLVKLVYEAGKEARAKGLLAMKK